MSKHDGLVERLRSVDISWSQTGEWCAEAAQAITDLTARVAELEQQLERREADAIHTCSDACQRPACVLRRRVAELEVALREIMRADQHTRIHSRMSPATGDIHYDEVCVYGQKGETARKALEGSA